MVKDGEREHVPGHVASTALSPFRLEDSRANRSGKLDAVHTRWGRTGSHQCTPLADSHHATGTLLSTLATEETHRHGVPAASRMIPAKSVLFFKGDPATHLYVVLSGRVKVSAPSDDGKEITFAILGPGELVGEMGVLDHTEHTATVTAMEPTEVAGFNRQVFLDVVSHSPALALKLMLLLCDRLRLANEMAEDISFLTLPVRLAKKLVALAQAFGQETPKGTRIGIQLCQQELANMVGTSRESINKQLSSWQVQGVVNQERGYVTIRRMEELCRLAGTVLGSASRRDGRASIPS